MDNKSQLIPKLKSLRLSGVLVVGGGRRRSRRRARRVVNMTWVSATVCVV